MLTIGIVVLICITVVVSVIILSDFKITVTYRHTVVESKDGTEAQLVTNTEEKDGTKKEDEAKQVVDGVLNMVHEVLTGGDE